MILNKKLIGYENKAVNLEFKVLDDDGNYYDLTSFNSGYIKVYSDKPSTNSLVLSKLLTIDFGTSGDCSVTLEDTDMAVVPQNYLFQLEFSDSADTYVLGSGEFIIKGDDTIRINQIKKLYGLDYDYYTLASALSWAKVKTKTNGFEKVVFDSNSIASSFKICKNVVDLNDDNVVDKNDFVVTQYNSSTLASEDITDSITSINISSPVDYGLITLDGSYPNGDYNKIQIVYYRTSKPYSELKEEVHLLEEYYVLYRLFDILEPYKLQHGMSSKTLNGVTVDFDQQGIKNFLLSLNVKIQNQKLKTLPFVKCQYNTNGTGGLLKSVLISKSY